MRKIVVLLSLSVCIAASAVKAYSSWVTMTQSDGMAITVRLVGDEFSHYYIGEDGTTYKQLADGTLAERDAADMAKAQLHKSLKRKEVASLRLKARLNTTTRSSSTKKGLVILMQFPDCEFQDGAWDTWNDILNEEGYSDNNAPGSVADYFSVQSYGAFDIEFDLYGPFTAANERAYYGQNSEEDEDDIDINVCYLVQEACDAIKDEVDFSQYDWDGDGEVEQVFILYAGEGENVSGNPEEYIWPHEYYLQAYDAFRLSQGYQVQDGIKVNQYACSSELLYYIESQNIIYLSGLGVFCHEFSHCLGLPDFYTYSGIDTFGDYDILDSGNYNNYGWCPPNYTAYERMACGWYDPIELSDGCIVESMETLNNGGDAYLVRNESEDEDVDEYYLLENRQQTGWDAYIPGSGLLISHYDYDETIWAYNTINDDEDHPRATIIPANNNIDTPAGYPYPYTKAIMFGVAQQNDSLTDNSTPAALVYNEPSSKTISDLTLTETDNSESETSKKATSFTISASYYMGKPITDITHENGVVGFTFMGGVTSSSINGIYADSSKGLESLYGKAVTIYDTQGRAKTEVGSFSGIEELGLSEGIYVIDNHKIYIK